MEQISKYLIPILKAVLNGNASNGEINLLVKIAHHFAFTRLRQFFTSQKIHFEIYPYSLSSVAMDCISELFQRNQDGVLQEINYYFTVERNFATLTDEEIIQQFRALVFTKLNDGIIRLYREYDPILSKIIRNLKIATSKTQEFKTFNRFGSLFVYSCKFDERNDHLPEYPIEEVEAELMIRINGKENTNKYLAVVLQILNETDLYRRFYSLIDIAIVIKRIISRLKLPLDLINNTDYNLLNNDIENILAISTAKIKDEIDAKYLYKGKIKKNISESYLLAIQDMMKNIYLLNNGDEYSYFDYLKKYIPAITYEEYRKSHRTLFEYMVKLSKNIVLEDIKELVN